MHLEILVEDSSGATLVDLLLPRIVGPHADPHTWRIHRYRGIGHLPAGLGTGGHPAHRQLLDQLPRLLQGFGKTPHVDAVVVIVDTDRQDCRAFLADLQTVLAGCAPAPVTLFRLAVEEVEAWYLGDADAILTAYPKAKVEVLARYVQDSVCGTWETLANAVYPGGVAAVKQTGWPLPGELKHEWARRIGPHLDLNRNASPSFNKLVAGLQRLVS